MFKAPGDVAACEIRSTIKMGGCKTNPPEAGPGVLPGFPPLLIIPMLKLYGAGGRVSYSDTFCTTYGRVAVTLTRIAFQHFHFSSTPEITFDRTRTKGVAFFVSLFTCTSDA